MCYELLLDTYLAPTRMHASLVTQENDKMQIEDRVA